MSVEAVSESVELFEVNTPQESTWNGRSVSVGFLHGNTSKLLWIGNAKKEPKNTHETESPEKPPLLWGYFDKDAKDLNEFEISVLLHRVQCSSKEEEEEKLQELHKLVDKTILFAGWIALACLQRNYIHAAESCVGVYFLFKEKIYLTYEQLKEYLEERNSDYEDLFFFSAWEEYQQNRQDMISQGIYLDIYEGYHDNAFYVQNFNC